MNKDTLWRIEQLREYAMVHYAQLDGDGGDFLMALANDYHDILAAAIGVIKFPDDSPEFNAHWDVLRKYAEESTNE